MSGTAGKLTTRQREALIDAHARGGRVSNSLHCTTHGALYDKGLIAWKDGTGFVLTDAGREGIADLLGAPAPTEERTTDV